MDDLYRSQFRLPYALYERLKTEADKAGRSVNAELVARLISSFEKPSRLLDADVESVVLKLNYDELAEALFRKAEFRDNDVQIEIKKREPAAAPRRVPKPKG